MPRRLLKGLHRNRDSLERAALALVLPFVAGLVNAEGFFIVGVYTSHVTGTVAHTADALSRWQLSVVWPGLALVAAFSAGAAAATILVERPGPRQRAGYAAALGMEALALGAVTALGALAPRSVPAIPFITTLLLCFSMGTQNALVSKLSGAVVRNTHLTGIVTDLGIESVRGFRWFRAMTHAQSWTGRLVTLARSRHDPQLRKLRLHSAIFGSFFLGAVIGPLMYQREGYVAMLLPIAVLVALLAFDLSIGLRGNDPAGVSGAPPATPP